MDRREELFWKRVDKNGPNGCWLWLNELCGKMHGHTIYKGWRTQAHRVAWFLKNGVIPDGMCVLHKCDNGRCVNPDHLFLGTQQDNIADMRRKCRGYVFPLLQGEDHGRAKIKSGDVRKIRELYASGCMSQNDLADLY